MTRIKRLFSVLLALSCLLFLVFLSQRFQPNLLSEGEENNVQDVRQWSLETRPLNLKQQAKEERSVASLLSQPIINNHNFSYIHNPSNICQQGKTVVLFVVPSAPGNFVNRIKVRNGSRSSYISAAENHAKLLFFLGRPDSNGIKREEQLRIDEESSKYGDIVQDGFSDTYKNIRLKAVSMLKWAVTFCADARFVIRTDDDVRVDPQKLLEALERKNAEVRDFIMGSIAEKWEPIRGRRSKYFLSTDEYPHSTLPPFVLGGLLGYPMRTVKLLYEAALRTKPLWLDDVFITGICAARVNVSLVEDPDFVFKHWAW